MRARLGLLFPVALLGAGCQMRPWTPSVSVAFWSEDVPHVKEFSLPASYELAQRWQVPPASPWARYHKSTLISSVDQMGGHAQLPDVDRLEVISDARDAAATNVARAGLPADTMWLLDLRGAASCAFASTLSREATVPVAPVVTFNNWPSADGLIPAEETLAGMLQYTPKLPSPDTASVEAARPVFLLDSWRLAYRNDEPDDDVFDNRYMLQAGDLPSPEVLKERGITRVVYVVEDLDDAEVEEDDLYESFRAWQTAGVGHLSRRPRIPQRAIDSRPGRLATKAKPVSLLVARALDPRRRPGVLRPGPRRLRPRERSPVHHAGLPRLGLLVLGRRPQLLRRRPQRLRRLSSFGSRNRRGDGGV